MGVDTTQPTVINCPSDITQAVANAGDTSVAVTWIPPTATDNVTPDNQINALRSHEPGDVFNLGQTTVSYIFTDQANNQATCSFTVTVTTGKHPICLAIGYVYHTNAHS